MTYPLIATPQLLGTPPPCPPPSTSSPSPSPPADRGEKLQGWEAIAAHLGVGEHAVRLWARLPEDPLPVRLWCGRRYAWSGYLKEWRARRVGDGEVLRGWEEILTRLDVDQKTARKWARRPVDRLPVYGMPLRPWIYASALRDWMHRQDRPAG